MSAPISNHISLLLLLNSQNGKTSTFLHYKAGQKNHTIGKWKCLVIVGTKMRLAVWHLIKCDIRRVQYYLLNCFSFLCQILLNSRSWLCLVAIKSQEKASSIFSCILFLSFPQVTWVKVFAHYCNSLLTITPLADWRLI